MRQDEGVTAEPPPYEEAPGGPTQKVPKKMTVTRVAAARTRYLIGAGTKRINDASRAGGADESGLARLIWTHAAPTTRRTR